MGQLFRRSADAGTKKQATSNQSGSSDESHENRSTRVENIFATGDNKSTIFGNNCYPTSVRIGKKEERARSLTSVLRKILPLKIINVVEGYAVESRVADFSVSGLFGNQMEGRLLRPHGIAVSKEHVYVSNTQRNQISVYSFDGNFIREWSYQSKLMTMSPTGIAFFDNKVYVCDSATHRIYIFSTSGNYLRELNVYAPNIAVTEDRIYLCSYAGVIKAYTYDGKCTGNWNIRDDEHNHITKTKAFAIFSDRIFVCDYNQGRILVFSLHGTYIRSWNVPGRKRAQPCAITVIHGEVYVGDKRYNCVYAFDWSGNYLRRYGSMFDPSPLQCVGDIAVNEKSLFVCDYKSNIVCVFR